MKKTLIYALSIVALLTLFSCASTPNAKNTEKQFEYYELENGIPVIINNTDSSQVVTLDIVVKGGKALLTPEFSGLEEMLFNMMTVGSKKYTYNDIKQIQYLTSTGFTAEAMNNGSCVGITTLDYYFDQAFDMLIDGFLNPTFDPEGYQVLQTVMIQQLQQTMQDPMSILLNTMYDSVYEGHPYEAQSTVTVDSFQNMTVENMQKLLPQVYNANRIAIVAVGNLDGKALVEKLNSTIGTIEGNEFIMPEIPEISPSGEAVISGSPAAQGTGFVTCALKGPAAGSKDEMANRLAANMFSEILFNIVRENYGAVYSINAQYTGSKAAFNYILGYMVSDLENFTTYIDEAEKIMSQGNLISGRNATTGEFEFSPIEDRLEGYKNTYLNSKFYGEQTNSAIASSMARSLLNFDDAEEYLHFTQKVRSVTAEEIVAVFNTYWTTENIQWFAVTGQGEEQNFKY